MYIYVEVWMYIYVEVCMYIYVEVYIYVELWMYIYVELCMYIYVDVQICGCIRSPIICGCVDVVVVVADRLFIAIFHSIDFTLSKLLIQISPHSGTVPQHPHTHR